MSNNSDCPVCHHEANLKTLYRVFKERGAALVECRRKSDGAIVAMLCGIAFDGVEYHITPFAEMVNGNPYELYESPDENGGFHEQRNRESTERKEVKMFYTASTLTKSEKFRMQLRDSLIYYCQNNRSGRELDDWTSDFERAFGFNRIESLLIKAKELNQQSVIVHRVLEQVMLVDIEKQLIVDEAVEHQYIAETA